MAKVKSRDTSPEMEVRRALHRAGYRFRVHRADIPGCPDLVFPRHRVALFVHGWLLALARVQEDQDAQEQRRILDSEDQAECGPR